MAATGGGGAGGGEGCAKFLSNPNYECVETIVGHSDYIWCVVVGNGLICTGGADNSIRVSDADTKEHLYVLAGLPDIVNCLTIVPDSNFLASGDNGGVIQFFDLSTRKLSHSLPGGHSGAVTSLLTVPGTDLLVSCSCDTNVKVWDLASRACVHTLAGHTNSVVTLANVPGNLVASGSRDGSIRLWNVAAGQSVRTIERVHGSVRRVVWVPGLDLLASGGTDGRIKLLDVATGEIKSTFTGKHEGSSLPTPPTIGLVMGLLVVPGTTLLASCSDDKTLKVWDGATGKCVQTLTGHVKGVTAMTVDPSTGALLSVGKDKTLKVWIDLKAASARRRYCTLACLSSLTAKLYAGEDYYAAGPAKVPRRAADEGEEDGGEGGGGGQVDGGGRLQGVLAFEIITSADVWRYILEFV